MIRLALLTLASALIRRADRVSAAEVRVGALIDERDDLVLELAEVRKDLIACIADRDLAKEIGEELLRERDALMFENQMLRADDEESGLEMVN